MVFRCLRHLEALGRSLRQRDQILVAERQETRRRLVIEACEAISFGAANPSFVLRVRNRPEGLLSWGAVPSQTCGHQPPPVASTPTTGSGAHLGRRAGFK